MYKVLLKASAQKALGALPLQARRGIAAAIDELASAGIHARNVKKLQPPIGGFRMRVGAYRVLFDRHEDIIVIHAISKRADAYRS
jgi:mRNA-degrading endonuclease RelE of RelBE toxin-antitoxin system